MFKCDITGKTTKPGEKAAKVVVKRRKKIYTEQRPVYEKGRIVMEDGKPIMKEVTFEGWEIISEMTVSPEGMEKLARQQGV